VSTVGGRVLVNLADAVTTGAPMRRGVPRGFQSGASLDLDKGTASIVVKPADIPEDETAWRKHILAQTGMPVPDDREVILTGVRTWTMGVVENKHLTFRIEARSAANGTVDIAELVKIARGNAARKPRKATERALTQTRIVGLSDEQLHKVDRHGGTPEFFEWLGLVLAELDEELRREPCQDAVIALGGDLIEGFENTGSQMFTNDGSHPTMLTTAHAYLTDTITRIAARFERVRVLAVPSNHTAWRRGKDNLGKPGDDYGLAIVRTVAASLSMSERWGHVEFVLPSEWEVSVAVQVRDDVLALTHGHVGTSGPASFPKWFAGQVVGDSPIARASIVLSGHYHHYRSVPLGNIGDRQRVHIQMPAMDGGSSWFTNATGEWSPRGIWTAVIRDGYGLDHERVLRASL